MSNSTSNEFQILRSSYTQLSTEDCKADADLKVMREFGRIVRDEEEDQGRPVFHRQARIAGHFSYFKPTNLAFYDKPVAKDNRSAKEFEYLNSAGTWLQLADAGVKLLRSEDAPITNAAYVKHLYAIRKCIMGALEIQGARFQYFINYLEHGPAEAKLISELGERRSEPILSQMMNDVQKTLGDKRIHEMVKLLSKQQAERAIRGSQGAATADAAAKPQ